MFFRNFSKRLPLVALFDFFEIFQIFLNFHLPSDYLSFPFFSSRVIHLFRHELKMIRTPLYLVHVLFFF